MNAQGWRRLAIITVLLGVAYFARPVYSQDDQLILESVLTIFPLEVQPIGVPITVTAQLTSADGRPNPNKVLTLYLNEDKIRRIRTDDQGMASIRISRDLSPADYTIRLDFSGTRAYLATSATTTLTVRPAELTVVTIPPLVNVPFALNGQEFASDEQGVARIAVSNVGDYQLEVLLEPDTEVSPDTRVTFDRWKDEFQPRRTVTIDGDVLMEAGFTVSHPVSQTFIDLNNEPVDMSRIETLTIKGSDGSNFTFEDGQERWLRGGRIARRQAGLEETQIQYSIESVLINGSNTVNQFQQRFFVEPNGVWTIQLLLYYADFSAADALFGSPIGSGIKVIYPDGYTEILEFGKENKIRIGPVPRGEYKVQVIGASGVAPVTPLALSRNQELDLKVLSSLNIGLGAAIGLIGVFGLLIYGRPHLPRLAYRTTRDVATLRFLKPAANGQYLLPASVGNGSYIAARPTALLPPPYRNNSITEMERAVVQLSRTEPLLGRRRVALKLKKLGLDISPHKVRLIQHRYRLGTLDQRLAGYITESPPSPRAPGSGSFSSSMDTLRTLVRSQIDLYRFPGYLCSQDTYRVGTCDGIGDVFQQTFIDFYSGIALVKLYVKKDSHVAADMLVNTVQPWYARNNINIVNVMTDRGREYVPSGRNKQHEYQNALASLGITHIKSIGHDPQNNEICRVFHETIREQFYSKILRMRNVPFPSLDVLQWLVDEWVNRFNAERMGDSSRHLNPQLSNPEQWATLNEAI